MAVRRNELQGKKFRIRFYENRKIYFAISLGIMGIGLIFNVIFGTQMSIQFYRAARLIKYSYAGEVNSDTIQQAVKNAVHRDVTVTYQQQCQICERWDNAEQCHAVVCRYQFPFAARSESRRSSFESDVPERKVCQCGIEFRQPVHGQSFFAKCIDCHYPCVPAS